MFTGIISDIGIITSVTKTHGAIFMIQTHYDLAPTKLGASIACSGVCLTVTDKTTDSFTVEASAETLSRTTLGTWQVGTHINLERALALGDELGGHIVSGHVDGVATVHDIVPTGSAYKLTIDAPEELKRFIAEKGSITLDGVSLTVNGIDDRRFWVTIIPHTWQNTTISQLKPGMGMNIEIDMLARYVERMLNI